MKEIFEYLIRESSSIESWLRVQQNELFLRFKFIDISIIFDYIDEGQYDDMYVDIEKVNISALCDIPIKKIIIQKGSAIYIDSTTHDEYLEDYEPYTMMAHELIRKINSKYKSGVQNYRITAYCIDDSCSMCSKLYEYGFQLEIGKQYWKDLIFFQYIVEVIDKEEHTLSIPSFYDTNKEVFDSYEVKFLATNTKTRRLGYLKILLSMFQINSQIPIIKLATSFERLCQRYESYRVHYKNTKGKVIETKSGSSAMPYIELAQKLGLILKGSTTYRLGKNGKLYNLLIADLPQIQESPFILTDIDKYFWGEILLREDYWLIYPILEQASLQNKPSYKSLKMNFKEILLKKIGEYIDDANIKKVSSATRLQYIKRQITQWNDSSSYMEHVIMPRLNWLYDLDYIVLNKDLSYHLTESGYRLLLNLSSWNDISLWLVCSPVYYLERYYMRIMDNTYTLMKKTWNESYNDLIENYLEKGLSLFKTLAPNRITYSLFASYLKYSFFVNENLVIDEYDIRNLLETEQIPSFIIKYQSQFKDGYIQKKLNN